MLVTFLLSLSEKGHCASLRLLRSRERAKQRSSLLLLLYSNDDEQSFFEHPPPPREPDKGEEKREERGEEANYGREKKSRQRTYFMPSFSLSPTNSGGGIFIWGSSFPPPPFLPLITTEVASREKTRAYSTASFSPSFFQVAEYKIIRLLLFLSPLLLMASGEKEEEDSTQQWMGKSPGQFPSLSFMNWDPTMR